MDGTAVYYPVACLFVAQQKRFPMQIGRQISMAIVAAFMSIGAAPVPSAGMANLVSFF
jgi:Na+/H+-dicarboxylate symporter